MAINRNNIVESGRSILQSIASIKNRLILSVLMGLSALSLAAGPPGQSRWGDETWDLVAIASVGIPAILMAIASVTVWKYEPPGGRPIMDRKKG